MASMYRNYRVGRSRAFGRLLPLDVYAESLGRDPEGDSR